MVAVIDGQIAVLVGLQPGIGQLLELFQHFRFLLRRRAVARRPADDRAPVAMLEGQ